METKHTPGPWHSGKGAGSRYTVYDKFSQRVGDFFEGVMVTQRSNEECAANARLGAAAPEMYEVIAAIATAMNLGYIPNEILSEGSPILEGLRAAIAKAEGT